MFEALEKAIHQREKLRQSNDLYYHSEDHKQFYSTCKDIPFYRWEYLLNNHEAQHTDLAKQTGGMCCWNHIIGLPEKNRIKHNLYMYVHVRVRVISRTYEGKAKAHRQHGQETAETVLVINGCLIQAF
jgi:hypothetical protein